MATTYSAPGTMIVDIAGHADNAQDVVIQPDGSILIAGFSQYSDDLDEGMDFSLTRLLADGSLDKDYGNAGRQVIHKQIPLEKTYTLQVQADGAVVTAHEGHDDTAIVQRWGPDGKADLTFNSNAAASLPSGFGSTPLVQAKADGGVLVSALEGHTLKVAQLNADGTRDMAFGTQGTLTLQADGTFEFMQGLTPMADGGLLVQGAPGFQNSLLKYTADGELDTDFGEGGIASLSFLGSYRGDVAIQDDGKILVASTSTFKDFAVTRLNADGSLDLSFGNQGTVGVDLPGDSALASEITLLDDGRILLAGHAYANHGSDFAAVRLNADGSLDTTFGSTDGTARLVGSSGEDKLQGLETDEILRGLAGDDLLQGNLGRDLLSGGAGNDVLRYASVADSFRCADSSGSDRLLDFNPDEDRIDLSALGFTGIGNGYDGTLAIRNNADDTRTYLKSFEANGDGQRFELVIDGNVSSRLNESNLLFSAADNSAPASADTGAKSAEVPPPGHVELTLIGTGPNLHTDVV
ncbi:M10 family metallopeptidase C-terminal domain-containing protein [Pseudomonas sp. NFACC36]|uniref:M10 family metallopeptidase C-terminal domain-containing protein n=1 Tax=Pseudomonas sp. NFACC36 TaxID=1566197 RepID=UPI00091C51A7|nr:type I secretion target [Pseudomonas sp. NFACC36]SFX57455.1 delta-60 repeat domain-containing protein [Pseudomonas sp. NFACC36]